MKVFEQPPTFRKTTLKNGVRIVSENHPFTRATSLGVYIDTGTRDEPSHLNGAAHFIEHLVFKGTKKRSAYEIAKSLEAVGGELNAYTTREYTCFHATSLKEHLPLGLDVVTDLTSQARFSANDFEMERQVVLQEIDMSAEQLEEYVFDLFFEEAYRGHDLGRPILGTAETLNSMTRKQIMDFYQERYRGSNVIVSVAGSVDHDRVVELAERALGRSRTQPPKIKRRKPKVRQFRRFVRKPSEQVHLLIGYPSSSFKDRFRFEAYVANAILGGGMTSRLYQSVREEKGLAYTVYSYLHAFSDSGLLMVYAGTSAANVGKVVDTIEKEMKKLKKNGIPPRALKMYKEQVMGQILLGADDIENRMNSLGVNEMIFGRYRPVEEVIGEIERVSKDSVQEYLEQALDTAQSGAILLGDFEESQGQQIVDLIG